MKDGGKDGGKKGGKKGYDIKVTSYAGFLKILPTEEDRRGGMRGGEGEKEREKERRS